MKPLSNFKLYFFRCLSLDQWPANSGSFLEPGTLSQQPDPTLEPAQNSVESQSRLKLPLLDPVRDSRHIERVTSNPQFEPQHF